MAHKEGEAVLFLEKKFFCFQMNSKYLLHEKNVGLDKKLRSPPIESAGPDEAVFQGK